MQYSMTTFLVLVEKSKMEYRKTSVVTYLCPVLYSVHSENPQKYTHEL